MLQTIKTKLETASRLGRYFWWVLGAIVLLAVGAGVLLRRRAVLGRLATLRKALAAREQALLDAQTAAATARHSEVIDRHNAQAAQLRQEVDTLKGALESEKAAHAQVLAEIDLAGTWEELAQLRAKGNAR